MDYAQENYPPVDQPQKHPQLRIIQPRPPIIIPTSRIPLMLGRQEAVNFTGLVLAQHFAERIVVGGVGDIVLAASTRSEGHAGIA